MPSAFVPVQYGLYSSFVGCFVYCFLGTAKDVTLGPTAIMSLLVSSYAFHDPVYAVLLTFLSGCIQLAMGLLHLGFLLDFISCPVIKGFTSAASITISFNQVKNILGLHGIPRQFFLQVYETLRRIGETRPGDAILGLTCLAALAGLRAMKSRLPPASHMEPLATRASYLIVWTCATGWKTLLPGCPPAPCSPTTPGSWHVVRVVLSAAARNALVVLFAGLVAYCFQLRGSQPLTLTGSIPQGLPPCRLPPFSKAEPNGTVPFGTMVEDMGVGLAVVPLMGLVETIAIAKAFALQNDYRIDPNQELLAMGFANVLGSFFSSYPVTGSFGRSSHWAWAMLMWPLPFCHPCTAVPGVCGQQRGQRARLVFQNSSECTDRRLHPSGGAGHRHCHPPAGALVLLSLAYLTSLFYYIPKAALAAVIISAVVPMFDAGIFRTLWRVKRLDLVPLCVTFLFCFWEVQYGIVAGVLVSGILLLYSIARPPLKVGCSPRVGALGPARSGELPVAHPRGLVQVSGQGTLLVQPGGSLHFPAIEHLRDVICSRALSAPSPRSIILDCHRISSIDYTVVVGLAELLQELRKHGISLAFCSLQLRDAGWGQRLQLLRRHTLPWAARRAPSPRQRGTRWLQAPQLQFLCPQDQVLRALLAADLEGFRHFPSWEEAERCGGAEPGGSGAAPFDSSSTSESSLLPTGLIQ
ncbi:Sodium-independent sulfate anion transporter [Aix galericulata]|nr:Sodium-independent sulfate anion transporter [Aix galericulata]